MCAAWAGCTDPGNVALEEPEKVGRPVSATPKPPDKLVRGACAGVTGNRTSGRTIVQAMSSVNWTEEQEGLF